MSGPTSTYGTGYLLTLVATVLLLLIIPAASAAARRLKPAWRAWVWPLVFAGLALTSLCGATATALDNQDYDSPLWKAAKLLAGLSFTFLTLNTIYRAVPEAVAKRFAPLVVVIYGIFAIGVLAVSSFLPVLIYDAVCSVLVFLVYSTLYAQDRDRNRDALPIMIGTGLILLADLSASFEFNLSIGAFTLTQLIPFNLLVIVALIFFFRGASASYSVKYDRQRSQEREKALSSRQ